jgi:endonuclease VIII
MSEGDTIHHMARRIRAVLAGRTPDEILTPHPRHGPDRWPERLVGRAVTEVQARGKHLLAGIGNVWKAEACFATALNPWRPVGEVSDEQALAVVSFIREYMARAAQAPEGNGVRPSAVYKRAGQRCLRCSATVCARGQGENNRITYWCPGCQL